MAFWYFGEAFFTAFCLFTVTTRNLLPAFYSVNLHEEISTIQILRLIPLSFLPSAMILFSSKIQLFNLA